ncbi:MAG: CYTH domain-containing protein [Roseivirga sp.]
MAVETERKFLLKNDHWRSLVASQKKIMQGYLNAEPERTVRIRISDNQGIITIKSKSEGLSRAEYEYDIPVVDAREMIALCEKPIIEKTRNLLTFEGKLWEIDEFDGDNKGLIVAEVELQSEDEVITFPSWLGEEVSYDKRYFNASLIKHPYCQWKTEEEEAV